MTWKHLFILVALGGPVSALIELRVNEWVSAVSMATYALTAYSLGRRRGKQEVTERP